MTDDPKPHPVRDLVDHWQGFEQRIGLGKGKAYGQHAKAFAELLARTGGDIGLAKAVLDVFFGDQRAYHVETGWSVAAFQARMGGFILKARGVYVRALSQKEALERHNVVAGAEEEARASARRIAAEDRKRALERPPEAAVPCPPEIRAKMRRLAVHVDLPFEK